MQHLTEKTRKQVTNTRRSALSKLNGLKLLNSSRIVFAILAGESTLP
jgi:hypothetical protein